MYLTYIMPATIEVFQERLTLLENKATRTSDEEAELHDLRNQLCKLREAYANKGSLLTDINVSKKTLLNG
jgi:hypothetical protein